ncbi:MAG: DUF1926 domain-containing protein, partial [Spirochaetales bacterium]
EQWADRFLALLDERSDEIEAVLPSQVIRESRPRARSYFPSASYGELLSVSATDEKKKMADSIRSRFGDASDPYLYGGCFRQFLTRYGESNLMYAKMQYTHVLVNQIRGDKYRKQAAREELWRGQCHNAYWHGTDEGIYSNRLRKRVYKALIEAENKTRERGIFIPSVVTVDFDMDGVDEFLFQGQDINAYVHQRGGVLFELDYLPRPWNYLDTLGRTPETYHTPEDRSQGYSLHMPKSFVDHFISPETTMEEMQAFKYQELGSFVDDFYDRVPAKRDSHRLALTNQGHVVIPAEGSQGSGKGKSARGQSVDVVIEKRFTYKRAAVEVEYTITHHHESTLRTVFAPEINLAFLSEDADSLRFSVKDAKGKPSEQSPSATAFPGVSETRFEDLVNEVTLTVSFGETVPLWSYPLKTTARTATGIQSIYQGSALIPRWEIDLPPGASRAICISITLEKAT